MRHRSFLLASALLAACSSRSSGLDGPAATADARQLDGTMVFDGAAVDAVPSDAGPALDAELERDALPLDAAGDAAVVRDGGGLQDAMAGCDYLDLEIRLLNCGGSWSRALRWADPNQPACPPFYTLEGNQYSTLEAAIQGEGCNPACVYRPLRSVSFIDHCGRRNEYIVYTTGDDQLCPPIYEFSDGIYSSPAAWMMATSCGG